MDKWDLLLRNRPVKGFRYEATCRAFVQELRERWDGRMGRFQRNGRLTPNRSRTQTPFAPALRIVALMISCPDRARTLRRTLKNLAVTDWAKEPVHVRVDQGSSCPSEASQRRNAFALLQQGLLSQADYILFLEDDLQFNHFIRHNLCSWAPLLNREITLASLFNPGLQPLACDVANHSLIVDSSHMYGSQALLLSKAALGHVLEHWHEIKEPIDHSIPRLAAQLGKPIYFHAPSLVQHTGRRSTYGHLFFQAVDFNPRWKAPPAALERSKTDCF